MDYKSEQVYQKYRLLDAVTGEEKKGKYFILKIDSSNPAERVAVANALIAYAKTQENLGNSGYAMNVRNYLREGLTQAEEKLQ